MELNKILWRDSDHIAIKTLWEYLCTYCYLPRLENESVLETAIQAGLNSEEYFAFASGFDGERYIDLKYNQYVGIVERSGYLVKVAAAKKQIAGDEEKRRVDGAARAAADGMAASENVISDYIYTPNPSADNRDDNAGSAMVRDVLPPAAPKIKRFFMSADLDTTRINRDVQKYVEEIIQHLTSVDGANVNVSFEVHAEVSDGFSQQTVRTISENCRTLRVRDSGFEE